MRALVTGFEPFGEEAVNPALEALARLPQHLGDLSVATCVLPTAFGRALEVLDRVLMRHEPDIVLGLGLAGGRAALSLERVAINVDDARIADNDGERPIDCPVVAGGPAAHFTTLPIKTIAAALREAGLPAVVSNTAGTFVCNHVFYYTLHRAAMRPQMRAGFLHLPYLPEQATRHDGAPSMALGDIVHGNEVVLRVAAACRADIRTPEGAIS
jgi:pyroglutamyl-peptidase